MVLVRSRNKPHEDLKLLVDEFASFLKGLDKAGRHRIGEASNLLGNLMLKKENLF